MKLGNTRGAPTSQDRSAQLRRDQEAAPKLRTAFPKVEQLRFDLRFEGGGSSTPVPQSRILHPPARAHFTFPCPYSDCNGGFDLAAAVDRAVANPAHRIEGVLDPPPSKRRSKRNCSTLGNTVRSLGAASWSRRNCAERS